MTPTRTPSRGWDARGYSAALILSVILHLLFAAGLVGFGPHSRRPG